MKKAVKVGLILLLGTTMLLVSMGFKKVEIRGITQVNGLSINNKNYIEMASNYIRYFNKMDAILEDLEDQKIIHRISEDRIVSKGESHFIDIEELAEIVEARFKWVKREKLAKFRINDNILYLETLPGSYTNVLDRKKKDTYIASFVKDGNFYVELSDTLDYLGISYVLESNNEYGLKEEYHIHPIPVLMYHLIIDESEMTEAYRTNSAIITKQSFESHMDILRDHNIATITVEDLYNHIIGIKKAPDKSVLITFDDGYLSSFQYAYPILKERGLEATEFLITNTNREEPEAWRVEGLPRLSWKEIKKMKDVFSFYSHTHDLHHFAQAQNKGILAVASKEDIIKDLTKSDEVLNKNKVGKFKAFAYPFGHFSETTLEALQESDIKVAFTTIDGYAEEGEDLLQIDRIAVYPYTTLSQFKEFVIKKY